MKHSSVLCALLLFSQSANLKSESYSAYRLDDGYYVDGGRKNFTGEGRVKSIQKTLGKDAQADGFSYYNLNFAGVKFNSQKGGDNSDKASKNIVSAFLSPEITFSYSGNFGQCYLLASPILNYFESTYIKREISKNAD